MLYVSTHEQCSFLISRSKLAYSGLFIYLNCGNKFDISVFESKQVRFHIKHMFWGSSRWECPAENVTGYCQCRISSRSRNETLFSPMTRFYAPADFYDGGTTLPPFPAHPISRQCVSPPERAPDASGTPVGFIGMPIWEIATKMARGPWRCGVAALSCSSVSVAPTPAVRLLLIPEDAAGRALRAGVSRTALSVHFLRTFPVVNGGPSTLTTIGCVVKPRPECVTIVACLCLRNDVRRSPAFDVWRLREPLSVLRKRMGNYPGAVQVWELTARRVTSKLILSDRRAVNVWFRFKCK